MSTWSYKKKPTYFPSAVPSPAGWKDPSTNELLACIGNTEAAALVAATTLTPSSIAPATAVNVATGGTITINATVTGNAIGYYGDEVPYVNITIGANVRKALMTVPAAKTDGNTLTFVYTVVAGDVAAPGATTVENKVYGGQWSVNIGSGVRDKIFSAAPTFPAITPLLRVNTP